MKMNVTRMTVGALLLSFGSLIYMSTSGAPGSVRAATMVLQWSFLIFLTFVWSVKTVAVTPKIVSTALLILAVAPATKLLLGRYIGPLASPDPIMAVQMAFAYAAEATIYLALLVLVSSTVARRRER